MAVFRKNDAWWIDVYVDGRRVRRKIGPDKRTAELAAKDMQIQAARGKWLGLDRTEKATTLYDDFFVETFLPRLRASAGTRKSYDQAHRVHLSPAFGKLQLRQIRPSDIDGYASARARDAAPTTVNHELALIHAILNAAVRWGFIGTNPATGIERMTEPEQEIKTLSPEQARQLFAVVDPADWFYTFLAVALNTGIRRMKLVSLTWDQVDFEQRIVSVVNTEDASTKSTRIRRLPLNRFVLNVLAGEKARRDEVSPYLFPGKARGRKGKFIAPETANRRLKKALKAAGLPTDFRVHDLRHTYGTRLAESGEDVRTIMELMGHSTMDMTMRYIHTTEARKAAAVEKLDLGDAAPLRVVS